MGCDNWPDAIDILSHIWILNCYFENIFKFEVSGLVSSHLVAILSLKSFSGGRQQKEQRKDEDTAKTYIGAVDHVGVLENLQ